MLWRMREAKEAATGRDVTRWGAALASLVALMAIIAVAAVVLGRHSPSGGQERTSRPAVAVQVVDLRCLTRRPEDCLAEPVSPEEPHGAVCATCHDLWQQREEPGVVRPCTDTGCHEDPSALTPFHATLTGEVLADCGHCHVAHDFRVPRDGRTCSVCHTGGGSRVTWAGGRPLHGDRVAGYVFRHADHPSVACASCHGVGGTHGAVALQGLEDCRACHHANPNDADCGSCHPAETLAELDLYLSRVLAIEIGSVVRPQRWIPFDHARHTGAPCADCHTEGQRLGTGEAADCSTCHGLHHNPRADCSACHSRPSAGAHDRQVHLGCGGGGCHDAPEAVMAAPRTRELCLACHRDRSVHQEGRDCAECHILPSATP